MFVRLTACAVIAALAVSNAQEPLPRFRAGANLVTVDASFSKDDTAVTDLTSEEIKVRVKRSAVQVRARNGYLAPCPRHGCCSEDGDVAGRRRTDHAELPMTALRRGPSTGLAYVRATEPRFRRTERLRIEVALPSGSTGHHGRVLTSQGQPLPLNVTSTQQETNGQTIAIAGDARTTGGWSVRSRTDV